MVILNDRNTLLQHNIVSSGHFFHNFAKRKEPTIDSLRALIRIFPFFAILPRERE